MPDPIRRPRPAKTKPDPEQETRQRRRSSFERQMIAVYVLCGALVALLLLYSRAPETYRFLTGAFSTGIPTSVLDDALRSSIVEGLTERDYRQMGRQRERIAQLARRHVGRVPSGSLRDIELIQELLDRRAIEADDVWALQGLGITLGDVLAQQFAIPWVVVNDDYGRSRALQIGDDEDFVFPVTIISKRVEAGQTVYVDTLYEEAAATVREVRARRGL